ncbi:MAG: FAD-dependent oxidoreductase [bacterium]|nr:FAD-dependent oxidoreductase [bacterium]
MVYDLVIVGGGAAAMTAGIYAGRKKMKVAMTAGEIGGQAALQPEFHNYPGYIDVDGYKLVQNMKQQVSGLEVDLKEPWLVEKIISRREEGREIFQAVSAKGEVIETRAILVATGGKPKFLQVPGEQMHTNKGVTYCATCDAPLFVGKRTAVIGGGNTGTEAALLLTKYATKVYLLHRGETLKADEVTKENIKAAGEQITVIYNAITTEILGKDGWVTGLRYKDAKSEEVFELALDGVFIAVGFSPNSALVKDLVEVNRFGEIVVDSKTNMTSHPGIFAAGDVTDIPYKQAIIASGEAAKATLAAHQWLMSQK